MSNPNEAEKYFNEITLEDISGTVNLKKVMNRYADLVHATRIAAVELPSPDYIFVSSIKDENIVSNEDYAKGAKWMHIKASNVIATKQSRIEELEREVERLKSIHIEPKEHLCWMNADFNDKCFICGKENCRQTNKN